MRYIFWGLLKFQIFSLDALKILDIFGGEGESVGPSLRMYKNKSTPPPPGPNPGYQWESDKFTFIHHKREPRGVSFHDTFCSCSERVTCVKELAKNKNRFSPFSSH